MQVFTNLLLLIGVAFLLESSIVSFSCLDLGGHLWPANIEEERARFFCLRLLVEFSMARRWPDVDYR